MSKKQQPSRSVTEKSANTNNLFRLEQLVTEFSEYLSIFESFLENIDRPRDERTLNLFDLHRITGQEIFVVNDDKRDIRLSYQACTKIQDMDRRKFLFILALNWLVARFVKLNDDKEIEYSQQALFLRIKSKEELLCSRLTVVQLQLTQDQSKLQKLQKQFVRQFGVGLPVERDWEKRYSIREYAGCRFPVDRKSLEKVNPHILFIVIMKRICLPLDAYQRISLPPDAVQPPGKQIAATSTSSEAASRASKRHIATSDDENGSEDDEVEDMTNQKLQSKGINSVKRQKTKTSDGEKASAARGEEREEEEEEEENDEDDQEEGEEGEGRNEEEDEDDEEEEEEKEEENQQSTATRRKVKLSSTKRKKNQEVEFEGDDDVELTTEEQAEQDSAVNALTTFAETNFEALANMHSDSNVLLSFQTLMLELKTIRRSRTKNLQFLCSC